jgi:ribosomal protein S27AE
VSATLNATTGEPTGLTLAIAVPTVGTCLVTVLPSVKTSLRFISADVQVGFRFRLASTLAEAGTAAIRLCPTCGRCFIAEFKKRQFCSERCKSRMMMQRFRERNHEQENRRVQAAYEKKLRQRPGLRHAKIATRKKGKEG